MVAPARKCPPEWTNPYHVPEELRAQGVCGTRYHDWLREQAKSLRQRITTRREASAASGSLGHVGQPSQAKASQHAKSARNPKVPSASA